jgi:ubiquitin-protein ligase
MNGTVTTRLLNEIKKIHQNTDDQKLFFIENPTNLQQFEGYIFGPIDSPYYGYKFKIRINIPERYPYVPPTIKLLTPILHPNIDLKGNICMDTLKDAWKPILGIATALISLISLLSDPNPKDPLNKDITDLFNNKTEYFEIIKKHCEKYAIPV